MGGSPTSSKAARDASEAYIHEIPRLIKKAYSILENPDAVPDIERSYDNYSESTLELIRSTYFSSAPSLCQELVVKFTIEVDRLVEELVKLCYVNSPKYRNVPEDKIDLSVDELESFIKLWNSNGFKEAILKFSNLSIRVKTNRIRTQKSALIAVEIYDEME